MAEGRFRHYAENEYEALSAGTSAPGGRMLPILCISEQEFAFVAPGCEGTSSSPMELLEGVHAAVRGRAL